VAMSEGYDVKQSEVHGMAQRGGSVTSHFRFGDKVWSPLVPEGTADLLMAFEALEGLRYVNWLKPGGVLVYNAQRINPSPVSAGLASYPADIDALIKKAWPTAKCVNANELASKAGTVKAANVAMLGAISRTLPFASETWEVVIRKAVPAKTVDVNLQAFRLGAESAAAPAGDCKTR
jgi:indolepyruvate ferredoxin oxidoreductase beta subunit